MSSIEKAMERLERENAQGKGSKSDNEDRAVQARPGNAASDVVSKTEVPLPSEMSLKKPRVVAAPSPAQTQKSDNAGYMDRSPVRLDMDSLSLHGYLTPATAQSAVAEEYRRFKQPLLRNAFGKGAVPVERGNLIMLTSALPGEGKTFTTLNLALSLAMERDTTVLMVDSDVIKTSLTRILNLQDRPGLTDVLLGDVKDLGDVIVNTEFSRLRVIPAGRPHLQSTELLASDQMKQVARELSERYSDRVVLLDAPPLLVTSQAGVLADIAGQILVVVEAAKTPQSAIIDAVAQLDHDKVIGMVLNKSRTPSGGGYYGGYYGPLE